MIKFVACRRGEFKKFLAKYKENVKMRVFEKSCPKNFYESGPRRVEPPRARIANVFRGSFYAILSIASASLTSRPVSPPASWVESVISTLL